MNEWINVISPFNSTSKIEVSCPLSLNPSSLYISYYLPLSFFFLSHIAVSIPFYLYIDFIFHTLYIFFNLPFFISDSASLYLYISFFFPLSLYIYNFLSHRLSVYIYNFLSPSLYIYLLISSFHYISLFIYLSIYLVLFPSLSTYISISLYLYICFYLSLYLFLSPALYIYVDISQYLYISFYLPLYVSLSISPYFSVDINLLQFPSLYSFASPSIYISFYVSLYISFYLPLSICLILSLSRSMSHFASLIFSNLILTFNLAAFMWFYAINVSFYILSMLQTCSKEIPPIPASHILGKHEKIEGVTFGATLIYFFLVCVCARARIFM